ncbi:hypothetical protein K6Q96_06695 [Grimontia kaedaensis]|uniref:Uncharacterized protein n=1 Tax=Grimontia kaedaensis TaxID=2872157 RepID=A0ABY4WXG3_9GAMM|nr:hypothetical protein [Grimontia kaedaensis]USH03676.1 hypothetical protein K6Q96_06695 [Grimontia kaedaensis]
MDTNYRVLAELMGQGANLSVPRLLIRFFQGQYNTAAVMSQLIFWSGKSSRKDGWFYKSQSELADELYLSRDQVKREIGKIKKQLAGVVTTKVTKADGAPTTHFKIDLPTLIELLSNDCAKSPNGLGDSAQSNGRDRPNHGMGESAQSITDPNHIQTTDPIDHAHNVETPLDAETEPPVFELLLKGGGKHPVTQSDITHLSETYPTINVPSEIAKASDWLISNPTKRKTPRGIKRFLSGWLSRAGERRYRSSGLSQQAQVEAHNASAVAQWLESHEENVYEHVG